LTVSDPEYIRQANLKVIPASYRQGRRELRVVLQNIGTTKIDIKKGWIIASAWLSPGIRLRLDYHLPGEKCSRYHSHNSEDDWETCSEESTELPKKLSANLDRPLNPETPEFQPAPSAPPTYEEATSEDDSNGNKEADDAWVDQEETGRAWDVSQIQRRSPVEDYSHEAWADIQKKVAENINNIIGDVSEEKTPTVAEYEEMVAKELQDSIEGYVTAHRTDNSNAATTHEEKVEEELQDAIKGYVATHNSDNSHVTAQPEEIGEAELIARLAQACKESDEETAVGVIFNLNVGTMKFLMGTIEHALDKKSAERKKEEDEKDSDKSSISSWEAASKPKPNIGEMPEVDNCLCYCRSCRGQWRLPHYCHRGQGSCSPMNDGGNGNRPNETSSSESSGSYSNLRDNQGGFIVPDKCRCWCEYCKHARHYRPHYCSRHMQECAEKKTVQREDEVMDTEEDKGRVCLYPKLDNESSSSGNDGARECSCYCSSCRKALQLFPHPCPYGHKPKAHNSFRPWKWMAIRRQIRFLETSARNLRLGLDGMMGKKSKKEE